MNTQLITNIIGTHAFFWRSMAIETYEQDGLFAWVTNCDNKYLNGVTSTSAKITITDIENIIEFFRVRNLPWLWNLNPICEPDITEKLLISRGFKCVGEASVMYYDLALELPDINLNKYNIREITNDDGLSDWNYLQEEGFGPPTEEFYQATKKIPYGKDKSFHHYIVYVNEKPISCATLSISKYGARIDNVATCDDFLRQGFAKAVTVFAMMEAKKFGCKMVCLESSNEGLPLYLKIGFKEIYKNREYEL